MEKFLQSLKNVLYAPIAVFNSLLLKYPTRMNVIPCLFYGALMGFLFPGDANRVYLYLACGAVGALWGLFTSLYRAVLLEEK